MNYEHILVESEDGVGIVTLNRPDKLNAMNRRLSSELHDAVKRFEANDAIACSFRYRSTPAFCSCTSVATRSAKPDHLPLWGESCGRAWKGRGLPPPGQNP